MNIDYISLIIVLGLVVLALGLIALVVYLLSKGKGEFNLELKINKKG